LNRRQLVVYRKVNFADDKYKLEIERVKKIKETLFQKISATDNIQECVDYLRKYELILNNLEETYRKKDSTMPYTRADITR